MNRIKSLSNTLTAKSAPVVPTADNASGVVQVVKIGANQEVAIITLAEASTANALSPAIRKGLSQALNHLNHDPKVKVVCLRSGLPGMFSSGAHLAEFSKYLELHQWLEKDLLEELDDALKNFSKPMIAAVTGVAIAGGFVLALNCDIVLAAEDAMFQLKEVDVGVALRFGGSVLPKMIGKHEAMRFALLGAKVTPQRAKELGLVQEIYHPDKIFEAQEKMALRLAKRSGYTLQTIKKIINNGFEKDGPSARDYASLAFNSALGLPGAREGIDAFLTRRKADFTGK